MRDLIRDSVMSFEIITVVGARPQFVKSVALSRALAGNANLTERILHTGQHYDREMSDIFFDELGIPEPAWKFDVGGGRHGQMTGRMIERIEEVLIDHKPHVVLVYGDTNSTLAGALASVKLRIPVAHVEAGLRSFNFYQPEELNRVLTDRVSEILYPPTESAAELLRSENVPGKVEVVGDLMYDSTLLAMELNARRGTSVLDRLALERKQYAMVTLHRAENVDDPIRFRTIVDYIVAHTPGMKRVLPIHPRTRVRARDFGVSLEDFVVIDPVGYLDSIELLSGAQILFSDSGGMQKEAYFCGTRCVTMRDETEWGETIAGGWNRLWTVEDFLPQQKITAFGEGAAGKVIADSLERFLTSRYA